MIVSNVLQRLAREIILTNESFKDGIEIEMKWFVTELKMFEIEYTQGRTFKIFAFKIFAFKIFAFKIFAFKIFAFKIFAYYDIGLFLKIAYT
jgi:hypothetical protein